MVYIVLMIIKPFSDHSCPVVGVRVAMVTKIMAGPAFLYMTPPKHDGILIAINSGTTPVWKNLLSIYSTLYPTFTQVFPLFCQLHVCMYTTSQKFGHTDSFKDSSLFFTIFYIEEY